MGKTWMAAVAACATAIAMAGCGSSGDDSGDSKTTTPAAYAQAAQRICADAARATGALPAASGQSVRAGKAWAERRYAIQSAAARRVAALDPPEGLENSAEQLATALDSASDLSRSAQIKLVTNDRSITDDIRAANDQHATLERLTRELRVPACQWL